ncbi:hypothetical protein M2272_003680 [Mycobacterium frederiksbergense]|jgi:hypothetical protein|uniref:ESX-1 secretion-associated protein n=1 Tax=Mycolicibacterium frederiksbergense TaxID=117567 RepID=A0ABT6L489_9MYCO|nr:type VII secretion target [Mycolicibacterium frederiksbergense]MDH6197027.1 hypothetical protein [Mycolicibacterium frederiksbergense]
MAEVDAARVDIAAVLDIARQYDVIAEIVDTTARTRLGTPAFGGANAGRAHTFHGDAVRAALDDLTDSLRQWARAAREVGATLRASADRYVIADAAAADRVG